MNLSKLILRYPSINTEGHKKASTNPWLLFADRSRIADLPNLKQVCNHYLAMSVDFMQFNSDGANYMV
jgi:hypothetical protein